MAVPVVLDTVLRCKICASAKRVDADALICQWKSREVSKQQLLDGLRELGIDNPNIDNVKGHVGTVAKPKHTKFVDEAEVAAEQESIEETLEELRTGKIDLADPDDVLKFQLTAYYRNLQEKFARGEDLHLTHDHAIKVVAEMTKRKHNEAQSELLGALTGGIGQVFQKALGTAERPALDAGVVDAEVIEVEE